MPKPIYSSFIFSIVRKTSVQFIAFLMYYLISSSPAYAWWIFYDDIIRTLAIYSLILLTIIGIGAYTTFFNKYIEKSFLDLDTYHKHRNFWLSIAVLTILLFWLWLIDKSCYIFTECSRYFPLNAAVWVTYLLTTTLGPAVSQNPSNKGITGLALLFSNIILIAWFVLYLKDIDITKNYHSFTLVVVTVAIFLALTFLLNYFQLLKNIVKEALFTIAICLDVLWLFLVVMAFVFLIKSG